MLSKARVQTGFKPFSTTPMQWDVVEVSLLHLVQNIFSRPECILEINDMFISLVPKVDSVVYMKQFRPIGLCNVSYKAITKMVARRIRYIMPDLVGPEQSAFIPHRQGQDNIILAQEIFYSMRHKKGKKGWMAIKNDLEKAYDRLKWLFVKETPEDIGFPTNIVNLIWNRMDTTWMRLLWNGEALEEFSPSREIR